MSNAHTPPVMIDGAPSTYCGNYPDHAHDACPSSVECTVPTYPAIDGRDNVRNADFRLETGETGTPVLHAVTEGPRWNGWATPVATAGALRSFVRAWRSVDPSGVWGSVIVDPDTLVLTATRSDGEDADAWSAAGHVNGEPVYMLDGWVWVHVGQEN